MATLAVDDRMKEFVRDVACHPQGVTPKGLSKTASRDEDKARQRARRLGYVAFRNSRWCITDAGKRYLTD